MAPQTVDFNWRYLKLIMPARAPGQSQITKKNDNSVRSSSFYCIYHDDIR